MMKQNVSAARLCIETVVAAAAGSGELVLMNLSDAYPNVEKHEIVYVSVIGLLLGIFGRGPVWIIGPAIMLYWPVGMLIDLFKGGYGLNLWPISLVFCAAFSLIGFIGVAIGRGAKWCCLRFRLRNNA